jgi:hypothetical protein
MWDDNSHLHLLLRNKNVFKFKKFRMEQSDQPKYKSIIAKVFSGISPAKMLQKKISK